VDLERTERGTQYKWLFAKEHIQRTILNSRIRSMKRDTLRSSFSFIEPMKALSVPALPAARWLYEVKFDGYRALAFKNGKETRLVSRNQKTFNYPELLDTIKLLPAEHFIIDGEIAALDPKGRSSFQLLQAYEIGEQRPPLVYYAFDLLSLDGADLIKRPLVERRKELAQLLKKPSDNIRFSAELQGDKEKLLAVARQFELEGLIAKKPDSLYDSGRRSGAWVKLTKAQEFVIGGYMLPEGSRKYFGSLIVGYYGPQGLLFAGRVGTGFSEKVLADLYAGMQKLKRTTCPFVNLPEKKRGRWAQSLTPAIMKAVLGSNRFWSPRSSSRSGRTTTSFVNLCSSDCGPINKPRTWFANSRKSPFPLLSFDHIDNAGNHRHRPRHESVAHDLPAVLRH
jgi:DNA ligase D-like protein (predicted ligase)